MSSLQFLARKFYGIEISDELYAAQQYEAECSCESENKYEAEYEAHMVDYSVDTYSACSMDRKYSK